MSLGWAGNVSFSTFFFGGQEIYINVPVIGHVEAPLLKVGPTCLNLTQLLPEPSQLAAVWPEGAFPRYQIIGPWW